jgi:hypothetical protein
VIVCSKWDQKLLDGDILTRWASESESAFGSVRDKWLGNAASRVTLLKLLDCILGSCGCGQAALCRDKASDIGWKVGLFLGFVGE